MSQLQSCACAFSRLAVQFWRRFLRQIPDEPDSGPGSGGVHLDANPGQNTFRQHRTLSGPHHWLRSSSYFLCLHPHKTDLKLMAYHWSKRNLLAVKGDMSCWHRSLVWLSSVTNLHDFILDAVRISFLILCDSLVEESLTKTDNHSEFLCNPFFFFWSEKQKFGFCVSGYYMYTEASDSPSAPRRQNDRADLVTTSPLQPSSYCLNFW